MFKNNNFAKVVEDLGSLHLMVKKQPLANRLPTACHGAYSQLLAYCLPTACQVIYSQPLAKAPVANCLPMACQGTSSGGFTRQLICHGF
jgi:hypothetical protein